MIYIYSKETKAKIVDILNYEIDFFNENKEKCYPDFEEWKMISVDKKINFPVYNNGEVREATKEEKIALGYPYELEDGEKVEEGKLVIVPIPTGLYRAVWDSELEEWKEGATSEEILIERKNILLQAKAIKQEIKDLEEIAEWGLDEDLDSVDTIKMLQDKFDVLIEKVKELTKIYKKLKNQETQAI